MIIKHSGSVPMIDEEAFIAPGAVICGSVKIGKNCRVLHGAAVIAEGSSIEIGENCIILENAVLRSTSGHPLKIGNNVLIGPNAHVAGCTIENNVFLATGVSIFHGAVLRKNSEVRINGVVHLKTVLQENSTVPIGWVAVGDPVKILPADKHEEIWAIQKELNFPGFVYGINRKDNGESIMPEITKMMSKVLGSHLDDEVIKK